MRSKTYYEILNKVFLLYSKSKFLCCIQMYKQAVNCFSTCLFVYFLWLRQMMKKVNLLKLLVFINLNEH